MTKYNEFLKNPLWQKKRLEIMQRDNFTCQICGHKDKTLHVHHIWYEPDRNPWDYPDSALITLCDECHSKEHNSNRDISKWVKMMKENGILLVEIKSLFELIVRNNISISELIEKNNKHDDMDLYKEYCKNLSMWRNGLEDGRMD